MTETLQGRADVMMEKKRKKVESSPWARAAEALLSAVADPERRADLLERFDERAGICEFEGKLPRAEDERVAHDDLAAALQRSLAHAILITS